MQKLHSEQVIRRLFAKADTDGSGLLDRDEIAALAEFVGVGSGGAQHGLSNAAAVDQAMREMDEDEDGTVDFEEFYGWYTRCHKAATEAQNAQSPHSLFSKLRASSSKLLVSPAKKKMQKVAAAAAASHANRTNAATVFASLDTDGSGSLDRMELASLARELSDRTISVQYLWQPNFSEIAQGPGFTIRL